MFNIFCGKNKKNIYIFLINMLMNNQLKFLFLISSAVKKQNRIHKIIQF